MCRGIIKDMGLLSKNFRKNEDMKILESKNSDTF